MNKLFDVASYRLVDKREDLIDRLTNAWLGGYNRMLRRSGGFRP